MLKILIILLIILSFYLIHKSYNMEGYSVKEFETILNNSNPNELINHDSKYQNIKIIEFDKNELNINKCLHLDDEMQFCDTDEYKYHETITHFATSYIKHLKKVLIIGGGDCMTLREVMKYPDIEKVDMLELDKDVISISNRYFNTNNYSNDPRVNIKIGDANKNIDKINNVYDLIIIDTTEESKNNSPIDTYEFLKKCSTKLNKNGILVKNGNNILNLHNLNRIFKHTEIIKYKTPIFDDKGQYYFILTSDNVDFKKAIKYKHNVKLKYYNINNHKNFIP